MIWMLSAGPERLPIMIIGPAPDVFKRIKGSARNQGGLTGLERYFAAIGKAHRAFTVENDESLIGVVAVHVVLLARFVIMHPGVKARRVKDVLAPFFPVRHIHEIDDFDTH